MANILTYILANIIIIMAYILIYIVANIQTYILANIIMIMANILI